MSGAAVEEGTKVCARCKDEKSKSDFYKSSSKRDGLASHCKTCVNSAARKKRLANKSKNKHGIDMTGTKVCCKCKKEKPKSEFSKNSTSCNGLSSWCKSCVAAADKKRNLVNKLKNTRDVDMTGTKVCTKCKEEKPKSGFFKNPSSRDGLTSWCKLCVNVSSKKKTTY